MIQPGTVAQARILAEERWNARFPFSLDPTTWDAIFQQYRPGEILQGIRKMQDTRDTRPEKVYLRFTHLLTQIAQSGPRGLHNN
jgi:hypothetical protein